jgi:glycosyltransferase involved in cell wall biosynthesis
MRTLKTPKRLVIAICTTGKNDVIRCLGSIVNQTISDGWELAGTLVVMNQKVLDRQLAANIRQVLPYAKIVHEISIGIPAARNAAQFELLRQGADWLAFIDDDCVAVTGWLFELTEAADREGAACVMGDFELRPIGSPSQFIPESLWGNAACVTEGLIEGQILRSAATRSVLYKPLFLESMTQPLFFDLSYTDSGGSDWAYFDNLNRLEGKIVFSSKSKVIEYYSGDRLTLRWHLKRKLRLTDRLSRRGLPGLISGSEHISLTWRMLRFAYRLLASAVVLTIFIVPAIFLPSSALRGTVGKQLIFLAVPFSLLIYMLGVRYEEYANRFSFKFLAHFKRKD